MATMKLDGFPEELVNLLQDHLDRYLATDGEDGYLFDATSVGGQGMVTTLILRTIGRKSGGELVLPLIFGESGGNLVVGRLEGRGAPASGLVPEPSSQSDSQCPDQSGDVQSTGPSGGGRGARAALADDGGPVLALRGLSESHAAGDSGGGVGEDLGRCWCGNSNLRPP